MQQAQEAVSNRFGALAEDADTSFEADGVVESDSSTTVKLTRFYRGVEVVGQNAMVHFAGGRVHDVTKKPLALNIDTTPRLTEEDAMNVLTDRYQQRVTLSEPAKVKIMKSYDGSMHLAYHMLTRTTRTHRGQEVFVDAKNGGIVMEADRAYDYMADDAASATTKLVVLSADTAPAHKHVDSHGYPNDIDMSWYDKAKDNDGNYGAVDRSVINAFRFSGQVAKYYKRVHNWNSYDNQGSQITSVVHMGLKMNNAFWTNEFKIMAYGDGDGEFMYDLSYALDVCGHEITHAVTSSTAKLVYAGESGALNESYSDFFGKMIDFMEGDWNIGPRIMASGAKREALRNMKDPEKHKQPGATDSPLRVPTDRGCTAKNDRCGVHKNSGIPNRAAALIVEAIGKENTEKLYFNVLTKRLTATSDFHDARVQTEEECAIQFADKGGRDSDECKKVTEAFDTVKM